MGPCRMATPHLFMGPNSSGTRQRPQAQVGLGTQAESGLEKVRRQSSPTQALSVVSSLPPPPPHGLEQIYRQGLIAHLGEGNSVPHP